ncbi:uncharacterized protein FOMMEDRAFT_142948 [Fomitiporia mediterranea MF3/22]|uniref:uncharacterized protein n=1 Tax=Fomitiporia mediterranea (strain MF3/22) TaxID=694068 RepID=UPI0004409265|nr:uncharacterized protein FOMMEDRAFT_142948 [Fomitiporia mediterranea MF3/22]EJC98887.1 hypothetical protein FOMMEDRAFT_142948 [Fomitiporia mediterranea MF3/22]
MSAPDITDLLPPSLNLPPHLSAHKYFFVCTLTVAAWDTLVLSPRSWRLMKTKEWPVLKIIFHFLRLFMPAEFIIVAVAFFDTHFTQSQCSHFFLFEPICTAILVSACSIIHVIRIHAIYDKNRTVLMGMTALFALQVVCMAITCGFYRSVPLLEGQGCIAGPKSNWVGIYWLAPTLLFTASFLLAIKRSLATLEAKPLSYWKLMLRDGLNLYGAIWIVNMTNMLFWFIAKPNDGSDTIKTIVTSMAAVLTTTMTLRIILSVRGSLKSGGSFSGSSAAAASSGGSRGVGTTHVISTRGAGAPGVLNINSTIGGVGTGVGQTYTIGEMPADKSRHDWDADGKSSVNEGKEAGLVPSDDNVNIVDTRSDHGAGNYGVKITIDRQVD